MAKGINKLEELREASGRWAAELPTDSIPCRIATEQAGDRTVASGCTARHLIPFGLCSHYNKVRGPGLVRCPSRGRDKSPQMNIYRMESNASSHSPTLTSLETDAVLGQRPESWSSHPSGLGDGENRPFILQRGHLQIMIQQLMSLPKLSHGPGTGRSLQCLTPRKYIILNNILWFTKHFLIIVLLSFTFYFARNIVFLSLMTPVPTICLNFCPVNPFQHVSTLTYCPVTCPAPARPYTGS